MRLALPLFLALGLTACGGYTALLPDGGRGTVNCPGDLPSVPVTVLDKAGKPVAGATVTVTWLSYGVTQAVVTDGRGVALVTAPFGPGVVRVEASLDDLGSPIGELTFAGGQCINAVTPRAVTLQLE